MLIVASLRPVAGTLEMMSTGLAGMALVVAPGVVFLAVQSKHRRGVAPETTAAPPPTRGGPARVDDDDREPLSFPDHPGAVVPADAPPKADLEQLVAGVTSANVHEEIDSGPAVGAEAR